MHPDVVPRYRRLSGPAPCRRFAFRQNKKSLSAGCSESTPPKGFFAQDKQLFATNVLEDDYTTSVLLFQAFLEKSYIFIVPLQ